MKGGGQGFLYVLLLLGLTCLFIFSEKPFDDGKSRLHRRHLAGDRQQHSNGEHTAQKHEPIAFDPLVAEIEQREKDRTWEHEYWSQQYRLWAHQAQQWVTPPNLNHHSSPGQMHASDGGFQQATEAEAQPNPWDNFNYSQYAAETEDYAAEDYLNSGHLNISHRLEVLFPLIDTDPHDGFVSLMELQHWHEMSALRVTHHRTNRDLEVHDLNRDGLVSFGEYLPHLTLADLEHNSMEVGGAGWWKEQFQNADEDGNGLLNHTEFHEFLHPEDSGVEKIHRWVVRQELSARSQARGFNLTWQDFHHNVFDVIRDYGAEESAPELAHLNPYRDMEARKQILSKAKFDELDTNKDGFITEDEADTFISKLRPGELYYARMQAEHLMTQADDNKDSQLSLEEMLAHPYVFYNTAYDHGDDAYSHDEFR